MNEISDAIWQFFFSFSTIAFLLLPLIIIFAILLITYFIQRNAYMKSDYYAATQTPYGAVRYDKGRYGEYLISKCLSPLEGDKKFLFNCYIPKNNNTTTEIDVILLHSSGIYVFESKNYSGWVYGSESQKQWT